MYKEQIEKYIEAHKDHMVEDIKALVRIDSQRGQAKEGMPFGEGPALCLKKAEEMLKGYGFKVTNYDNYVITADLNEKEKQLDILAHLDVVPVSDEWKITKPFEPVLINGNLYGRGTADDKGPAIAALYAMKAIKDLNIPVKKNVRLILGSDEECGSSDIEYYYSKEQEAPMTFSPDAEFPVINIEKGGLSSTFEGTYEEVAELPRLLSIKSGDKTNVVPGKAVALVEGLDKDIILKEAEKITATYGITFAINEEENNILKVQCRGNATHASTPQSGNNALTGLLKLLVNLPLAPSEAFTKLKAVEKLFPHNDYYGEALGVDMEDELSGKLTMCFSIFDYNTTAFKGAFDCRAALCATNENLRDVMKAKMMENGIKLNDCEVYPSHHVDENTEFVQTLLRSYESFSGKEGKAIAIGGGTYVHHLKNGVAFGCGDLEVDNHLHGDDEFISLDMLVMSMKIFADVIIKLCN